VRGGAISRTASSIIAAADPELKLCAYDSRIRGHDTDDSGHPHFERLGRIGANPTDGRSADDCGFAGGRERCGTAINLEVEVTKRKFKFVVFQATLG
jgi:hypothetical protein